MLKIGVIGAGHLGKIHIKCIKDLINYDLIGFYDSDAKNVKEVSEIFGIKGFDNVDDLIDQVDVIDVVTPTLSHFEYASKAIKKSKHVFIEKPVTTTITEAKRLMDLTHEANVKVQVGHVERFNPAFQAAMPFFSQPMFIEAHRLAQFNPRGTDVSVVLDLMIHDIDIVLSVVKSSIKRISASGVAVISDTPDIANARIEFDNGCVANLTSSRLSLKNMRKSRFFQKDAYITVDFFEKETSFIRIKDIVGEPDPLAITIEVGSKNTPKQIFIESPKIEITNAIRDELESFRNSIINNSTPLVSIDDGYNALFVAHKIIEKMKLTTNLLEIEQ